MYSVENQLCVVFVACAHQFQEAKGPEAWNQLSMALVDYTANDAAKVFWKKNLP
jgi:hypothetical protein